MLHCIQTRSDLGVMIRQGWEYSQLGTVVSQLLDDDLIFRQETGLALTPAGRRIYESEVHRLAIGGSAAWIAPLDDMRQLGMAQEEIYVPSDREVKSLNGRRR